MGSIAQTLTNLTQSPTNLILAGVTVTASGAGITFEAVTGNPNFAVLAFGIILLVGAGPFFTA
jgi:hypothetical protein